MKDVHRLVKIEYCVLREFLEIITHADGWYYLDSNGWDDATLVKFSMDKKLRQKAQNIIDNS